MKALTHATASIALLTLLSLTAPLSAKEVAVLAASQPSKDAVVSFGVAEMLCKYVHPHQRLSVVHFTSRAGTMEQSKLTIVGAFELTQIIQGNAPPVGPIEATVEARSDWNDAAYQRLGWTLIASKVPGGVNAIAIGDENTKAITDFAFGAPIPDDQVDRAIQLTNVLSKTPIEQIPELQARQFLVSPNGFIHIAGLIRLDSLKLTKPVDYLAAVPLLTADDCWDDVNRLWLQAERRPEFRDAMSSDMLEFIANAAPADQSKFLKVLNETSTRGGWSIHEIFPTETSILQLRIQKLMADRAQTPDEWSEAVTQYGILLKVLQSPSTKPS